MLTPQPKVIAIFYPETKGKTLEEMDDLFGKLITDTEHQNTKTPPNEVAEPKGAVVEEGLTNLGKH